MQCKICQQEFKSISSTHLKKHDITVAEYKIKYGSVVSDEYRKLKSAQNSGANNPNFNNKMSEAGKQAISTTNKGKTPHNKGAAMTNEQKEVLRNKALERNKHWRETDTHPNKGRKASGECVAKIKAARSKQVISPEAIAKAVQTKREKGYDMAPFRNHRHTPATIEKIRSKSIKNNKQRTIDSIAASASRLVKHGYKLDGVTGNIAHIKCSECNHVFNRTRQYTTPSKIRDDMCPVCYPPNIRAVSIAEAKIADFLAGHTPVIRNSRAFISPLELDMYLPEFNLAIEYDGLYWHSEIYKENNYHMNKTEECNKNNIRLIHIFEDEWENNKDIVKSRLLNAIGKTETVIYGRKTVVQELDPATANKFINANHIQGAGRANVHLGLYHNAELVSVMTFLKGDTSKNLKGWELNRFCSSLNINVVGGASKLFKYFITNHRPNQVTSFADNRWSGDAFYTKLGFNIEHSTPPNYWYFRINEGIRQHRYKLRKPAGCQVTEKVLREKEGYLRIYDCGSTKFLWTR